MQEDIVRDKKIYVNFQISNEERFHMQRYFRTTNFPFVTWKSKVPYEEYLRDLKQHQFCIVPPGNGLDSYRMWEAMYMGCVPIVPLNTLTRNFTNFPVVFIDMGSWLQIFGDLMPFDWESFLDIETQDINWDIEFLQLSFWDKLINTDPNKKSEHLKEMTV